MELNMETDYNVVWASDLQDFFNQITANDWVYTLGMDYPSQNTMSKSRIPDLEYSDVADDDWEPDFNWERWFNGGEFFDDPYFPSSAPSDAHVLQWLYENGHIPAGKYIVEVWW